MSLRDAANQFRARTLANIETVTRRLADARDNLAATENRYQETALETALSGDDAALAEVEKQVADARRRVETLELALSHAERLERERLAAARAAAEKSRLNAIRQHVGSLTRAATEFREASQKQIATYREMLNTASKIERLLTGAEISALWGGPGGARKLVADHTFLEVCRIGVPRSDQPDLVRGAWIARDAGGQLGSYRGMLSHTQALHEVTPLDELFASRFGEIPGFIVNMSPMVETVAEPVVAEAGPWRDWDSGDEITSQDPQDIGQTDPLPITAETDPATEGVTN